MMNFDYFEEPVNFRESQYYCHDCGSPINEGDSSCQNCGSRTFQTAIGLFNHRLRRRPFSDYLAERKKNWNLPRRIS